MASDLLIQWGRGQEILLQLCSLFWDLLWQSYEHSTWNSITLKEKESFQLVCFPLCFEKHNWGFRKISSLVILESFQKSKQDFKGKRAATRPTPYLIKGRLIAISSVTHWYYWECLAFLPHLHSSVFCINLLWNSLQGAGAGYGGGEESSLSGKPWQDSLSKIQLSSTTGGGGGMNLFFIFPA